MQFQVPQFIEVEDKIIGPLTIKQFFYLLGGAGGSYLMWVFLPKILAIVFIIPVAGTALALAFYKINNRPFISILEAALGYYMRGKLYIWSKSAVQSKPEVTEAVPSAQPTGITLQRVTSSRLKDLAWSLDVQEKVKE